MPNRSTHTTTGNWRARFASEFYDDQGRHWRVEFIDNDTASGHTEFGLSASADPHDVELTSDGFVVSWDGPTDHLGGSVIPSSCVVEMVLTTATMENIHAAIRDADDERFGLAVYLNDGSSDWVPWWVGTLVHEAIEYELQDLPNIIRLRASCGLNRLRNVEFTNNGSEYLGQKTFAELIAICLNKIPTANFWANTDHQLKEVVDVFGEGQIINGKSWTSTDENPFPESVLETTLVNSQAFSERQEPKEDEFGRRAHYPLNFNSCHDVLEHITNALGVRMFLSDFSFWTFPVNAYNWSHTLRVQRWTRTLVASETIRTTLSSGAYVLTATSEDVDFAKNIETNHALGLGWTNSFLLPVKRCALTHLDAGQRSVFGSPRMFTIDFPNGGVPITTFSNPSILISEGETLNIRGTYSSGQLRKEFGSALTGAAFNDHGSDRIGAYIILRLKIKANAQGGTAYYYVSEYNQGDAITIDMPSGFNGDFTNPTLSGFTVGVDDPVWQTSEGFFDIVVPWESSNPPAPTIDHSNGESYVGGLHVQGTDDDEFEYKVNFTQQDNVEHPFDVTTAPLPSNLTSYDGLDVSVDRIVLTHNHNVRETFPELESIFVPTQLVDYDHQGNDLGSFSQSTPGDRVDDFVVGVGEDSEDGDVLYFVEQTENTEFLDLGETVLQSVAIGGEAVGDGSISILSKSAANSGVFLADVADGGFHSITDTIDQDDDANGTDLLSAVCREQLFMRGKPRVTQRGEIVPQDGTSNTSRPFEMTDLLFHNCSTVGNSVDFLVPMTMTYNAGTATHSVDLALMGRQRVSFEEAQERIPKGPEPSGTGPIGPIQQGKGSTSGPIIDGLNTVTKRYDDLDTEITGVKTKTDLITITGSLDLDTLSASVGSNTTAIGGNTTDIATNASGVSTNAANISTNASNISGNAATIATNTTLANSAVSTANSAASQSATALSNSATNATDIATNTTGLTSLGSTVTTLNTTVAAATSDIAAIETKTDNITVTQAVDLDDMETQTGRVKNIPSSPSEARVIRVDTNGDLAAIADGTSGQVLTTDGSGGLSFTTVSGGGGGSSTASYVLASTSGFIGLTQNQYMYGNAIHGWDTDERFGGQTSNSSIAQTEATSGIILPTNVSTLKMFGSILNTSTTTVPVTITIFKADRPDGSASALTLTSLATDTVTFVGSNQHHNIDINQSVSSVRAGEMLFVTFFQSGSSRTQNVEYTFTLYAEE